MNKFISKILIVLICLSSLLTGCSEANKTSKAELNNTNNEANAEQNEDKKGEKSGKRPDMFGRVKSIIGNEVVLEIAEMPQRNAENQENKGAKVSGEGGNVSGQRSRGGGMREIKLTGDTTTLLIPVGIPINTRSKNDIKEIDLADIYVGSTLQIWFKDGEIENKTITRVVMMQGRE